MVVVVAVVAYRSDVADSVSDGVDGLSKPAEVDKLVLCTTCCRMHFFVGKHLLRLDKNFHRPDNISLLPVWATRFKQVVNVI